VVVLVLLPAGRAQAAPNWGNQQDVGPNYLWNYGSALAASASGATTYLHAVYTTDFVGGSFATDSGPHEGVYYLRSDDGGKTWSPKRLSPENVHADRGAIAAAGPHVYALWVTQTSYTRFNPSKPRVLYLRANDGFGAAPAWGKARRLSPARGRVDFPTIAASGRRVYVTWVDADRGAVRLAVSADGGATWKTRQIGSTTATDPSGEGRYGYPSVGAAGKKVGVAWIASNGGAVKARISRNGGGSWGPVVTLAPSGGNANHGSPSVAGLGGRLAFAWTTPTGVYVRVWNAGTFGPAATVATFTDPYAAGYDVAVALTGETQVGVAWSDCKIAGCDFGSTAARIDLSWSESGDDGATWSPRTLLRGSGLSPSQRINDGASVAWSDPKKRYVLYNGWEANFLAYDLFLKVGTG